MSKAVAFILSNNSDVTDLLNGGAAGVNTLYVEQEDQLPYVVIMEEDLEDLASFDSASDVDIVRFTVYAFARQEYTGSTVVGARDIITQVRQTLEAASAGTYNTEVISTIRKEGGVDGDYVTIGSKRVVMAQQTFTMWRNVTAGATGSVPAILLTQAAYDALGSYDNDTYYLIDNT